MNTEERSARAAQRRAAKREMQRRNERTLSADEKAAISDRYWLETESVGAIAEFFELKSGRIAGCVAPIPAPRNCAKCGGVTAYHSRAQRTGESGVCTLCRHRDNAERCPCRDCRDAREEAGRLNREAAEQRITLERVAHWRERSSKDYIEWALRQLTPAQRLFLDGIKSTIDAGAPTVDYMRVAKASGQNPRFIGDWLAKLQRYGLVGFFGNYIEVNPALNGIKLLGPTSSSRRKTRQPTPS